MIIFDDRYFMRIALKQAEIAASEAETPVGAVAIRDNTVIAKAYNQVEKLKDPTAHAEMILITQVAGALGDWRLTDITVYVTKEPCPMCMGAMLNARIKRLVFGITDPRIGAAGGKINLNELAFPNIEISRGVMQEEARSVIREFFKTLRTQKGKKNDKS